MKSLLVQATWREARRLLRAQRVPLIAALLLVAVNRLAALSLPAASRYIVDEVIGRRRGDLLPAVALIACAVVTIEAMTAFGTVQVAGVAGHRAVAALRQDLQERLIGLPVPHVESMPAASLASQIMTDSDQVRYLVGTGAVQLVASILTAGMALVLLFRLDPLLAVAVLAIVGLLLIGVGRVLRHITAACERVYRRQAELTGWLAQVVGGICVVKTCVAERREAHRFAHESHTVVREAVRGLRGVALLCGGSSLAGGAVNAILLVGGGWAVTAGTLSFGSLVMFIWLSGLLVAPVIHIASSAGEFGKAAAALGRLAQHRKLVTEAKEDGACHPLRQVVGTVDFEGVSYGYLPGRIVLRDICLHSPAGCTIALVGPSGSGKSTICRLLLALDRPVTGRILVDRQDLTTIRRRDYRQHIGVVLQEGNLLDGTIAQNIRYGRPSATWSEVLAAGQLAHCDEFCRGLSEGYDTPIGERGLRLSGGQRQRIAIARAILTDPRILVLDEATSHLDDESQLLVQAALRTLCVGRTTFVIAHRMSTVREADQILVLDGGKIVERGVHQELIEREGRYWKLYQTWCHIERDLLAETSTHRPAASLGMAGARSKNRHAY